jgi:Ca2+-binding EF-hand superfamily protein
LSASLIRAFVALDLDRDGALTSAEAEYMRAEAFKRYDANQDGKLSREEFVEGYRAEMIGG